MSKNATTIRGVLPFKSFAQCKVLQVEEVCNVSPDSESKSIFPKYPQNLRRDITCRFHLPFCSHICFIEFKVKMAGTGLSVHQILLHMVDRKLRKLDEMTSCFMSKVVL